MDALDPIVVTVFAVVYLGMMLGEIPGLALDRTGVALLGALVLVTSGRLSLADAWQAVDLATMGLLFGLMVVSAQFRVGGFYARFTQWLAATEMSPPRLLAWVVGGAAALSALLANDIVCLAMAPLLTEICARRRLAPVPFLLALACAANVGSAATLIGNPQNMLIGQALDLSFARYLGQALPPTLLGLVLVWAILCRQSHGRWHAETPVPPAVVPAFNRWQTFKGAVILAALVVAFLAGSWPRELVALAAAALILTSRKIASNEYLALIDWNLLILFASLFVVHQAVTESGMLEPTVAALRARGVDPTQPGWLFAVSVVLSNLVSNVPATMLLLPVATHPLAGPILAISSTLAGNLIVVGSIANIIVIDQAARMNVRIGWGQHARVGIPVTLATLAVAAGWLWLLARYAAQ